MARPRNKARSAVEAGLLLTALGLLALQGQRALDGFAATGTWWALPFALVLGILCADFATGAIHWFGDRFFQETTPVLGDALIRPFREHHVDPQAMVRHGLLELHGNSAIPVVAAVGAAQFFGGGAATPFSSAFGAWLVIFCATSMATNQFHMWAHAESVPPTVRWLQGRGVILSPARHAVHHCGKFDRSYCMTSGFLNPLLDRINFFGRLERGIRALDNTFTFR